jgi:hypothetical protein
MVKAVRLVVNHSRPRRMDDLKMHKNHFGRIHE